jgi:hypothetical protein
MLAVACVGMLVYAVAGASPDGRQLPPAPCAGSEVGGSPSCADQSMSVAAANNGGGSTSSTAKDSGSSTPTTGKGGGCDSSTTTTTDKGGQGSTTSTTGKGGQGSTTSTTGKDTTSTTGKGSTPTTGKGGQASVAAADTTGNQPAAAATGNGGCGGSTPPTTGKGSTTTTTDKGAATTTTTRKGGGGKGGGKGGKGSTTSTTGGHGGGPTTSTTVQGGTVKPDTSTGGSSGSGGSTGPGPSPDPGSNPIQIEQVPGDPGAAPDAGPAPDPGASDPGASDPGAGGGSFDMSPGGPIGATGADVPVAPLAVSGEGQSVLPMFGDLFPGSGGRAPAANTPAPARSARIQDLAAAPLATTGSASAMTQSEAVSRSLAGLQGSANESAFPATIISTPKVFPVNRWDPLAASVLVVLAGLAREGLKSWRRRATQIWPS